LLKLHPSVGIPHIDELGITCGNTATQTRRVKPLNQSPGDIGLKLPVLTEKANG
jgi:hypothetical protein